MSESQSPETPATPRLAARTTGATLTHLLALNGYGMVFMTLAVALIQRRLQA